MAPKLKPSIPNGRERDLLLRQKLERLKSQLMASSEDVSLSERRTKILEELDSLTVQDKPLTKEERRDMEKMVENTYELAEEIKKFVEKGLAVRTKGEVPDGHVVSGSVNLCGSVWVKPRWKTFRSFLLQQFNITQDPGSDSVRPKPAVFDWKAEEKEIEGVYPLRIVFSDKGMTIIPLPIKPPARRGPDRDPHIYVKFDEKEVAFIVSNFIKHFKNEDGSIPRPVITGFDAKTRFLLVEQFLNLGLEPVLGLYKEYKPEKDEIPSEFTKKGDKTRGQTDLKEYLRIRVGELKKEGKLLTKEPEGKEIAKAELRRGEKRAIKLTTQDASAEDDDKTADNKLPGVRMGGPGGGS